MVLTLCSAPSPAGPACAQCSGPSNIVLSSQRALGQRAGTSICSVSSCAEAWPANSCVMPAPGASDSAYTCGPTSGAGRQVDFVSGTPAHQAEMASLPQPAAESACRLTPAHSAQAKTPPFWAPQASSRARSQPASPADDFSSLASVETSAVPSSTTGPSPAPAIATRAEGVPALSSTRTASVTG